MAVMQDLRLRHDMQAEMTRTLTFPAIARRHGVTQRDVTAIYRAGEWASLPRTDGVSGQASKYGSKLRAYADLIHGREYGNVRTGLRAVALWLEKLK